MVVQLILSLKTYKMTKKTADQVAEIDADLDKMEASQAAIAAGIQTVIDQITTLKQQIADMIANPSPDLSNELVRMAGMVDSLAADAAKLAPAPTEPPVEPAPATP